MQQTRSDLGIRNVLYIREDAYIQYIPDLEELQFGIKNDIVLTVSATHSSLLITEHLFADDEPIVMGDLGSLIVGDNQGYSKFIAADGDGNLHVNVQESLNTYSKAETTFDKGVLVMGSKFNGVSTETQHLQLDENDNLKVVVDNLTLNAHLVLDEEELTTSNQGILMMAEGVNAGGDAAAKRLQLDADGNLLCSVAVGITEQILTSDAKGLLTMGAYNNISTGQTEAKRISVDVDGKIYTTSPDIEKADRNNVTIKGVYAMGKNADSISADEFVGLNVDEDGRLNCNIRTDSANTINVSMTEVEKVNLQDTPNRGLVVLGQVDSTTNYVSLNVNSTGNLNVNSETTLRNVEQTDANGTHGVVMVGRRKDAGGMSSILLEDTGSVVTIPKGSYTIYDNFLAAPNGGSLIMGADQSNTLRPVLIDNLGKVQCHIDSQISVTSEASYTSGQTVTSGSGQLMMGVEGTSAHNVQLDSNHNLKVSVTEAQIVGTAASGKTGLLALGVDHNGDMSYLRTNANEHLRVSLEESIATFADTEPVAGADKAVLICGKSAEDAAAVITVDEYGSVSTNSLYFAPKNYHMFENTFPIINSDGNYNLANKTTTIETIRWPASGTVYPFAHCFVKELSIVYQITATSMNWEQIGSSAVSSGVSPELIISFTAATTASGLYETTLRTNGDYATYFSSDQQINAFGSTTSMTLIGKKKYPYICIEPSSNGFEMEFKYGFTAHNISVLRMMITVSFDKPTIT